MMGGCGERERAVVKCEVEEGSAKWLKKVKIVVCACVPSCIVGAPSC